mgnify:CR=1 FL=1
MASSRAFCITWLIVSRSERISARFLVPNTLRRVVAASSLVEWLKRQTKWSFEIPIIWLRHHSRPITALSFNLHLLGLYNKTVLHWVKKSHSTLRAKRATFTKDYSKMPKMVHFGEFLKTWSLWSNSVTRHVSFNRTKIGGKCQN